MRKQLLTRCLADLGRIVGSALFPPRCLVCRSFFKPGAMETGPWDPRGFQGKEAFGALTAACLCKECGAGFTSIESPICLRCGRPLGNPLGTDHHCERCLEKKGHLRTVRAAGIYEKSLKETIHLLKYQGKLQLAGPLGRLLFLTFMTGFDGKSPGSLRAGDYRSIHVIVPVPLHKRKMRKRGFNQSWLLVRKWHEYLALAGIEGFPALGPRILTRSRWTRSQTGFGRDERRKNVKNAFSVENPALVAKKRVLIVDDVYTTGATGEECARVLRRAGALSVDLLALAR